MLAILGTLALLGAIVSLLTRIVRGDGARILAAIEGRSWTAQPAGGRPVTIRFSQPGRVAARAPVPAGLRAAA